MERKRMYSRTVLAILVLGSVMALGFQNPEQDRSPMAKIALREVGHQLLLSNEDSISLVSPVREKEPLHYRLSFQGSLSIEPDELVSVMENNLQKADLPGEYIVEVIQCSDDEVAYSYSMVYEEGKSMVPCGARTLPRECYAIDVKFNQQTASVLGNPILLLILVLSLVAFTMEFLWHRKGRKLAEVNGLMDFKELGMFRLYPEQNILVKETQEIPLSIKECQLLTIFASEPNKVIKREELTKRVWEDNGVIVGRSLDTYISKLRKKLKDDATIKITNVHGVGYKLEW